MISLANLINTSFPAGLLHTVEAIAIRWMSDGVSAVGNNLCALALANFANLMGGPSMSDDFIIFDANEP